jgi:hypothetical protein
LVTSTKVLVTKVDQVYFNFLAVSLLLDPDPGDQNYVWIHLVPDPKLLYTFTERAPQTVLAQLGIYRYFDVADLLHEWTG